MHVFGVWKAFLWFGTRSRGVRICVWVCNSRGRESSSSFFLFGGEYVPRVLVENVVRIFFFLFSFFLSFFGGRNFPSTTCVYYNMHTYTHLLLLSPFFLELIYIPSLIFLRPEWSSKRHRRFLLAPCGGFNPQTHLLLFPLTPFEELAHKTFLATPTQITEMLVAKKKETLLLLLELRGEKKER